MDGFIGAEERAYIDEMVAKYSPDVDKLASFIPWLEEKYGLEVKKNFDNPDIVSGSVSFPVYDGYLMTFINTADQTMFMDPNYVYTYSHQRIRSKEDEEAFIERCNALKDIPALGHIVAKYVLGGRTKAILWSEGVKNGVLLTAISKMQDILKIYR